MFFLTKNLGGYIFSVITAKSLSEMEIQNMIKALLKQKKTFFKYVIVLFIILSFTVLFFTSFLQFKLDEVLLLSSFVHSSPRCHAANG